MKPPVDRVRVSKKGKDILLKIKRNTGLQHWNEICRLALCKSLADPNPPPERAKTGDSYIEMDWKTFSGNYQEELAVLLYVKAIKDEIDISNKNIIFEYFKNHLESGILKLNSKKNYELKNLLM